MSITWFLICFNLLSLSLPITLSGRPILVGTLCIKLINGLAVIISKDY
jgi:hypothetical protein